MPLVPRRPGSDFFQPFARVAELRQAHVHFIHHRKIESAHLALGFLFGVEDPAAFDAATRATEHYDRKLIVVVIAGHHAGAIHQHGVVEQRARAFLNAVELARNVGDLFEEELIYLEPIGRVAVCESRWWIMNARRGSGSAASCDLFSA